MPRANRIFDSNHEVAHFTDIVEFPILKHHVFLGGGIDLLTQRYEQYSRCENGSWLILVRHDTDPLEG